MPCIVLHPDAGSPAAWVVKWSREPFNILCFFPPLNQSSVFPIRRKQLRLLAGLCNAEVGHCRFPGAREFLPWSVTKIKKCRFHQFPAFLTPWAPESSVWRVNALPVEHVGYEMHGNGQRGLPLYLITLHCSCSGFSPFERQPGFN